MTEGWNSWVCLSCETENVPELVRCLNCNQAAPLRVVDVSNQMAPAALRDDASRPGKIQQALEQSVEKDQELVAATERLISTIEQHTVEILDHKDLVREQNTLMRALLQKTDLLTVTLADLERTIREQRS